MTDCDLAKGLLIVISADKIAIRGEGNEVRIVSHDQIGASAITIKGHQNRVLLEEGAVLPHCRLTISGSRNNISIGKKSVVKGHLAISGNGSHITIGSNVRFTGGPNNTHLSVQEDGVGITIGDDSLIGHTRIRTSDSHSILDMHTKERVNHAASVVLGNRVWTAQDVRILKGVHLPDDTIVGAGSLVVKSFNEPNMVIAGVPAKVVRRGVIWAYPTKLPA